MSDDLSANILQSLREKPERKADELARHLGSSRAEINRLLYGPLKDRVQQDRAYRWSLVATESGRAPISGEDTAEQFANTDLARLCRYYLACLGFDDTGVSTFLRSKYSAPDYLEVNVIPRSPHDLAESEGVRNLLGRKRTEQGRYGLYYGYPIHIAHLKSRRSGWQGFMVEPIFLFPIEAETGTDRLTIDPGFPIINQKPFQSFTNAQRDTLMNELVQLENELGFAVDGERPDIDEIAMRLQATRPEWPWKEDIDPDILNSSKRIPIDELNEAGIYNRAVILMVEKSPFTQGLENELHDLARIPAERYAATALGSWLSTEEPNQGQADADLPPLLEVLPMNSEQRRAVSIALNQRVTIITGPPGTGKSQVVTNLLINAAWRGKRILFASKNNRAVDVVETRINALGSRPVLLRVGGQSYQIRLAEYVLSLMSSTTTPAEKEEFAHAKAVHERLLTQHEQLATDTQKLIDLRNEIDRLEQVAEVARDQLGAAIFARVLEFDVTAITNVFAHLELALDKADKNKAGGHASMVWPLIRNQRLSALTT